MDLTSVTIETDRLRIVPVAMKYKEAIFHEFREPVTLFMYPRPAKEIGETEQFIKESLEGLKRGTNLQMVILTKTVGKAPADKATGDFLGCAGLHHLDEENPEMGVWIKKSAHGKHYGCEAMAGMKQWADQNLRYKHIRYPVVAENIASRKIAESLGGKVQKEYEKTMQSGRKYWMVEYWIPPILK